MIIKSKDLARHTNNSIAITGSKGGADHCLTLPRGRDRETRTAARSVRRWYRFLAIASLIAAFTAIFFVNNAACQSDEIHEGLPLSYWISNLQSGNSIEKRTAASAMVALAPRRADVVDLLIDALKQTEDYELQTRAASALMEIGPFAAKAIPTLVQTLGAPNIRDNSVREQAASALSTVAEQAPAELTALLETEKDHAVILGLLRAIGYLRVSDTRTISVVLDLLETHPETADTLFERNVWVLDRIGEPAVAEIIARLGKTKSVVGAAGLVESLGKIYFNLEGREAPGHVIDALLVASRHSDTSVVWRAVRALKSANARSPAAAARMMEILGDVTSEEILVGFTAKTAAELFPQDGDLVTLVADWLRKPHYAYTADIIEALRTYGALSVPPVAALMHSHPTPAVLSGAAKVFADQRFARADVVSALGRNLGDGDDDDEVVTATLDALAVLAPPSLWMLPQIAALACKGDPQTRKKAVETAAQLAQYLVANDTAQVALRDPKASFSRVLQCAKGVTPDDAATWEEQTVRPLTAAVARLDSRERLRFSLITAAVLAALLAGVGLLALSWRVRRWLRLLAGRRWILHVGECDFHGRVVASAEGLRVSLRPAREGQSMVLERTISKPVLTPDAALLDAFQAMLQPRSCIRIEVEEPYFGQPWAKLLVGPWNNPSGYIGGQIALSTQVPRIAKHYARSLEFRALASGRGDREYGVLPMASKEAVAIGAQFRKWGAHAQVEDDATSSNFADALMNADVVHVSAHANFDRILLSDGPFTTQSLSGSDLAACRCRLLVLSACEAGDLTQRHALLWMFVRSGINVIAATRPVHDLVCKVLFEEFYAALLPKRQAEGIDLASAVRSAVGSTRTRLFAAFSDQDHRRLRHAFDQTVDSFVVFGDPSLSLKLARPS